MTKKDGACGVYRESKLYRKMLGQENLNFADDKVVPSLELFIPNRRLSR